MKYFPKNIENMVDLFSGGCTVGINTNCKEITFIDNNPRIISLLIFLYHSNYEILLSNLLKHIDFYKLSCTGIYGYNKYKGRDLVNTNNGYKSVNEIGFYKLRDDYNSLKDKESSIGNELLYLLMVYCFNNDIRFSKNGNFNMPVGKTDFNKNQIKKLKNFINMNKEIRYNYICEDFNSDRVRQLLYSSDFIYIDPPYLITDAVYNESNKWNEDKECLLLELLGELLKNNKRFIMSNLIERNGIKNELLYHWLYELHSDDIEVFYIEKNYCNSSYNKIDRWVNELEIIILPKDRSKW
jgi:DNA adenine methylase Dam